jgi:thiol:disulfide interchange protein DsbC
MSTHQQNGTLALIFAVLLLVRPGSAADSRIRPPDAHPLTKEEASPLVAQIFKERRFTVRQVNPGPIAGVWEVVVEIEAGKTILYIDASKRYFFTGPIYTVHGLRNKTEESLLGSGGRRRSLSQIPLADALILGNETAAKRVIAFLSPECAACAEMLQTLKEISAQRDDVVFYLKLLPDSREDDSFWKSETIVASGSLQVLEDSLAGLPVPRPTEPVPEVSETLEMADRLAISSTPTLVLPDGTFVEGALSPETLINWIEESLGDPN